MRFIFFFFFLSAALVQAQENPLQKLRAQAVDCELCLISQNQRQVCFQSETLTLILNPVNGQLALQLDPSSLKVVTNQSQRSKTAYYSILSNMAPWLYGGSLRSNKAIESGRPMEREVHFDGELIQDTSVYSLSLDALWKRSPGDLRLIIDESWRLSVLEETPILHLWPQTTDLRLKINALLVLIE